MDSSTIIGILIFLIVTPKILNKIFSSRQTNGSSNATDEFHWEVHPIKETKEYEQNLPLPNEFVAIDLETATDKPESICQIGIALVKNGEIIETQSWLVRPPKNEYLKANINIHGITPEMTEKAPGFTKLHSILFKYLDNKPLAAHYAYFDSMCLNSAMRRTRKDELTIPYFIDSCIAARREYPSLENHKLPTVCKHLNVNLINHHEATSDALACAEILIKIGKSPRISLDHVADKEVYDCYFFNREPKPFKVWHQTWNEKFGNK